jgi:hypothetical protein
MTKLLDEYDYEYTDSAIDEIIDEWATQKATLIEAFKKHPNYVDGKFLIAFDYDYERGLDTKVISRFSRYIDEVSSVYEDLIPDDIKEQREAEGARQLPIKLYDFLMLDLKKWIIGRIIDEETAKYIEKILPQVHPHTGEKSSRVINRICTYLGYHKHPDYNREFAKFADGLSPITIKRHTVLSINPLDYLTMSFGNSWASCHTIDKANKRGMPNSYQGMYSSGTMSYMLDGSSMVFYTVDSEYEGNDYWTQPKINRQMFHYGEDKLVQGRLYPQDNDGDGEAYTPYRNIVQGIMSTIFDFPNLWNLKKGIDAASLYIQTKGTHYADYKNFANCSLSRIKYRENENMFIVGAEPICVNCGNRHLVSDNINCCSAGSICADCGRRIYDEDDEFWVNDQCYCRDCVTWCECCNEYYRNDDTTYIEDEDRYVCRYCRNDYYDYCEDCDSWYHRDNMWHIEGNDSWVCHNCRDDYYYCSNCGEYFTEDQVHEDKHGNYYCDYCYVPEDEEEDC